MASSRGFRRIFLTTVVLVELARVLRVTAKFDRAAIATALESLSDARGVRVEEAQRVRRAIARFKVRAADFSDRLISETARDAAALASQHSMSVWRESPTFS